MATPTTIGMVIAAVIALTWMTLGFGPAVFVGVAIGVGALIGKAVENQVDVRRAVDVLLRRAQS
jgi:hypothetical protein